MTQATALLDRLLPAGPDDGPRGDARAWLATHGLPRKKEEAWRYTPLDEIVAGLSDATVATAQPVDPALVDDLAGDHGGPRLVFVNGTYVPELSRSDGLPAGLWCGELAGATGRRAAAVATGRAPAELARYDGFQALNRAAGRDTAVVLVDPGVAIDEPVHVVHLAVGDEGLATSHPRTVVDVGEGSRVALIETFAGTGGRTLTNASTTITLGRASELTQHRVQTEATDAVHLGHTRVDAHAGSRFRSVSVMLGGDIARHALDVGLNGPEATADLDGLYLPAGRQRHDNVVTVDHAASRGKSTQRFRGVIDDQARGSFGGHIVVRPGTVATDADQSNRNLLLSRTAQADTRPWLEIFADDVRCTHGATVGRLDAAALFYLRSRGIPLVEARDMLVGAFVAEIVDTVTPASLHDQVAAAVAARRPPAAPHPGEIP